MSNISPLLILALGIAAAGVLFAAVLLGSAIHCHIWEKRRDKIFPLDKKEFNYFDYREQLSKNKTSLS